MGDDGMIAATRGGRMEEPLDHPARAPVAGIATDERQGPSGGEGEPLVRGVDELDKRLAGIRRERRRSDVRRRRVHRFELPDGGEGHLGHLPLDRRLHHVGDNVGIEPFGAGERGREAFRWNGVERRGGRARGEEERFEPSEDHQPHGERIARVEGLEIAGQMGGVDAPRQAWRKLDLVKPPRFDVPAVPPDRGRAFGRMRGHLREPLRRERTVEPLGEERDRGALPRRLKDRRVGLPRKPRRMALEGCQGSALGARGCAADEGRREEKVGRVGEAGRLEGEDRSLPAVDVGACENRQERLTGVGSEVGDDLAGKDAGHPLSRLG